MDGESTRADALWRALGVAFFLAVIAWRVAKYEPAPIWWVETGVYVLIVVGYLRRTKARERAATFAEVALPLIGAPAPFVLLQAEWNPVVSDRVYMAILLAGGALAVVSYAFLGGSFSILVEARELRSRGPYRLVRHPVYLGQIIAATGVVLGRFVWWSALAGLAFAGVQVARAVLEERKLLRATPGYAEYRSRTWMLVPFIL